MKHLGCQERIIQFFLEDFRSELWKLERSAVEVLAAKQMYDCTRSDVVGLRLEPTLHPNSTNFQ